MIPKSTVSTFSPPWFCSASRLPRSNMGSSPPLSTGTADTRRRNREAAALLVALAAQSGKTRPQLLLLLSGGLLLAGLAAGCLAWYWSTSQPSLARKPVVVATRDIAAGASLDASSIQAMAWPADSVPPGAFSDEHSLEQRVTRTKILRGEPILEAELAPILTKGGAPGEATNDRRTVSVKVSEVIGLSGFALAGRRVEVWVNFRNAKGNPASKMVINGIPVLAVVQMASSDEAKSKPINAVTLEVAPEQAELLEIAGKVGSLTLVVRELADKEPVRSTGGPESDVSKPTAPPEAATEPSRAPGSVKRPAQAGPGSQSRRPDRVEVLRGTTKSTIEF